MNQVQQLADEIEIKNPQLHYALKYHYNHRGDKLDLERFPSMKKLYADTRAFGCVIKSVQGGVSEWFLVKGFSEVLNDRNIFWVLPDGGLISRFVKERWNKTLALSPEYAKRCTVDPETGESLFSVRFLQLNIAFKQTARGTIAFASSKSPSAMTEFVADSLFVDEMDKCDLKNLAMAPDRYGYAKDPHDWRVSNPTITGYAIDEEYASSSKGLWHIKCEHCGKYVYPDPFEVLLRKLDDAQYVVRDPLYDPDCKADARLICPNCEKPMNRYGAGVWIEEYPSRPKAGYQFSRLFTSNTKLRTIINNFDSGLTDSVKMMRCYNADFGIAYDAPGARITKDMLDKARQDYMLGISESKCVFGADVGAVINVVIAALFPYEGRYGCKVVYAGTVREEKDVYELYNRYNCIAGVIDGLPEERMSRRITRQLKGMFRAYYDRGKVDRVNKEKKIVDINRTSALDAVKEGLVVGGIILPADIETVPDFYNQLMASTRIYDEDRECFVWVEGSKADHYHHAMVYMNTAKSLVLSAM